MLTSRRTFLVALLAPCLRLPRVLESASYPLLEGDVFSVPAPALSEDVLTEALNAVFCGKHGWERF